MPLRPACPSRLRSCLTPVRGLEPPAMALVLALASLCQARAGAAAPLPEPVYKVRMEVACEPETGLVTGHEHLRWHNTAHSPVGDLQLHLYLNAFANNRSTFMAERGTSRGHALPDGRWGYVEVTSLRLADGTELKGVEQLIHPDDTNAEDRTVARYPLPHPVAPGEWLEADIRFDALLPGVAARTGVAGDYVMAGQWFPKVGVFEDAGQRGRATAGWNTHQYHADSEFYADFGDYDVSVTLPLRYRGHVGATGKLVEVHATDATVRVRFVASGVHDFAWAGDPRFVVVSERFRPEYDVPLGMRSRIAELLGVTPGELPLSKVEITLLMQPANLPQTGRYVKAVKAALAGYGLRLGAYPWATLTMVDPPLNAMGSAGMEYQTLFTMGTHPFLNMPPLDGWREPEVVVVHELGHNYWQGQIASNEFEEPWLDEGVNTYYEALVMDEAFGGASDFAGMHLSSLESLHRVLTRGAPLDPVALAAWKYLDDRSYVAGTYYRPAAVLAHLERLLTPPVFHRAMRRFFSTWAFRHPATADFERAMSAAAGRDLSWFFAQALHGTETLDYAVHSVSSRELPEPEGYFWTGRGRQLVEKPDASAEGSAKSSADASAKGTAGGSAPAGRARRSYRTVVVVERLGDFRHPVTVELRFANGSTERREWDGEARWTRIEVVGPARLRSAEVDPDGVLFLDANRVNNSMLLEEDPSGADKMLIHLMFWLQNVFALAGALG